MKKGRYAKYKGKEYKARLLGSKIRLISKNAKDLDEGFQNKKYPDSYTNIAGLPKLYIKEVDKVEVEDIYDIELNGEIDGLTVQLLDENHTEYLVATSDVAIGIELELDRKDRDLFLDWVPKSRVKTIIKKKPVIL
ncbi:hypothetical protein [Heyndrickxia acidiproducens]|uniref:hypothetical protein n=1 Tax=Heyndrickxia acidiproducens TaxID=1121084 RepID=UPI000367DABC|nr:hypothetical protein [Heyndrickxia acidiproducens]